MISMVMVPPHRHGPETVAGAPYPWTGRVVGAVRSASNLSSVHLGWEELLPTIEKLQLRGGPPLSSIPGGPGESW